MLKSLFWAACFAAACLNASEIRLASGGRTDYTIVLEPKVPTFDEKAAAEDLSNYLTRITGAKFTLNGDAPHKIHVGKKAPGDKRPLAEYERRVRCENGDVYIYGNALQGNVFAVYDFLEKFFDCRWYTFFGDECIPEKKEAVFKDLTLNVIPSFDCLYFHGSVYHQENPGWGAFRRRVRLYDCNTGAESAAVFLGPQFHSPSTMIPSGKMNHRVKPPLKYFKGREYLKTNPEFFSKGRRGEPVWDYQLCYSDPGLRKELMGNYLYVIEKEYKGGPARINVDLYDTGKAGLPTCWCGRCAKLAEKYGHPTGPYWDFVLEFSRVLAKKYPQIRLYAAAYQLTRDVPSKLGKLPKNVSLWIAPLDETDFLKPYTEGGCPTARRMLESWSKVTTGKLMVWTYPTVYPRPLDTIPLVANIERQAKNFRFLKSIGVNELFSQSGCGASCIEGFHELRVYLTSCLVRDVNADVPALIRDFMEHYYGAAAPVMLKYLAELEKCEKEETNFMRWYPDHRSVLQYLTPENLLRWQRYFDGMEKITANDAKANLHVRRARLNLDEATMSVWYKFNPGEMPDRELMRSRHDKTAIDSAVDELVGYRPVKGPRVTPQGYAAWTERPILHHYALAGKWRELPERFAKLPKCDVLRTVPFVSRRRPDKDPEAATGIAVKGTLPDKKFGVRLCCWTAPPVEFIYDLGDLINPEEIKAAAGKGYRYYYAGVTRLHSDSLLSMPNGEFALGYLYDVKHPLQRYDLHISLKLEADGKTLWCDELLLVKSDKPSTLTGKNRFSGSYPWPYDPKTGKRIY